MIDWYLLVVYYGRELDEWELRQDFDCALCGLNKDQHLSGCPWPFLRSLRRRMVPMVRA